MGNNSGKRRYQIGQHPAYDKKYDKHRKESAILNNQFVEDFSVSGSLDDPVFLKSMRLEWEGRPEDGMFYYQERNENRDSKMNIAKAHLKDAETSWQEYQQEKVNAGRAKPTEYPPHIAEKMFKAEAYYDVTKLELDSIKRRLDKVQKEKEKIAKGRVLKHGLQGAGKMRGGVLCEIDGQNVEPDSKKVLRIKDERSPYNGMKTSDYFTLVSTWKLECRRLTKLERAKAKDEGKKSMMRANVKAPLPKWDGKDFELEKESVK
ncbi:MAG: hypothetical protein K9I68_00325 [Bacteroidales bacterium]|nr:hypothetical protein [Bacteroidales bacterium]MCF8336424.1 hypothetical protein [Bacteroidales bacterium]